MKSAAAQFYLVFFTLFDRSHAASHEEPSTTLTSADQCAVSSDTLHSCHLRALTCLEINPKATVSDACVSYSHLDSLNRALKPFLKEITQGTDFFAYYRLNLFDQKCPVRAWDDETGTCGNIACKVDTLEDEHDIPEIWRAKELSKLEGPKAAHPNRQKQRERGKQKPLQGGLGEDVGESCVVEYDDECDDRDYCVPEDESATAKGDYVSLVDNPERFTGYAGSNVWDAIYKENCFSKETPLSRPSQPLDVFRAANDLRNIIQAGAPPSDLNLDDECLEKRVFHRIISGMHTSITTHICGDYLNKTTGVWGPNLECYRERLAPFTERVSNLYFNYALLLRSVTKLRTYLNGYTFCSGDMEQDTITKKKMLKLSNVAADQPPFFDESVMFQDPDIVSGGLKEDFRNRFRNVSRLMDCVGCDKCRLWGKMQTVGYGTALKVLFEYDENKNGENPTLKRTELVALVNTLDRVSTSLTALKDMRLMAQFKVPDGADGVNKNSAASQELAPDINNDFDDFGSSEEQEYPDVWEEAKAEARLVWRAYIYVLRSWIGLPSKMWHIFLEESGRLWNFWLGLPVGPRSWGIHVPSRDEL